MKFTKYCISENQLEDMDEAIDVLTLAYHACIDSEENGQGASPAVIASAVSIARSVFAQIAEDVRENGGC